MIICQGQSPVAARGHAQGLFDRRATKARGALDSRTDDYYALKDLKGELEFHSADQNGVMAVDEHFTKMQTILGAVP